LSSRDHNSIEEVTELVFFFFFQLEERQRKEARERKDSGTEWKTKVSSFSSLVDLETFHHFTEGFYTLTIQLDKWLFTCETH